MNGFPTLCIGLTKMRDAKYWIISDSHFNHKAIAQYCGRPENYNELIVENLHKAGIEPQDTLIHLGDVIFSKAGTLGDVIKQMPVCKKVLVKGNHDLEKNRWYIKRGFDFVCEFIVIRRVVLTHVPIDMKSHFCFKNNWRFNIHGHLHNTPHRLCEPEIASFYDEKLNFLYSPELENYKPKDFDDYVKEFKAEL